MKGVVRCLQAVYSVYAFIVFIALMLLIFPFAALASLTGRIRGGNLIYRLCRFWADCWFPLIGIFHQRIYEAPLDRKRASIFVANHISYLDAPILCKACRQPIRPLGKVEMSRVPIFGFIYRNAIVTVDRSSPGNRARSVQLLKSILSRGISVMVFPEGTFNMGTTPLKSFYDGAFRVAIETQTPVRPLLFLDAYRRMPYESLFRMTPGRSRILYLEEVPVTGYTLEDVGRLRDEVYARMELRLRTYGGAWRQPAVN
jgi:1-acyl-sn-glycerol-3-phosphate acyltransferase